jgi:hypothetical protein
MAASNKQDSGLDFLLVKTTAQKAEPKKASSKSASASETPKGRTAVSVKTAIMTKLNEAAKKQKKDPLTVLDEAVSFYLKNNTAKK